MFFILTAFSTILKWSKWSTWWNLLVFFLLLSVILFIVLQIWFIFCCLSSVICKIALCIFLSFIVMRFFNLFCKDIEWNVFVIFSSIVWVTLPNRQIQFLSLIGCSRVHFCLKLFQCVSKDTSGWCQVANHNLWSSSCSNSNSFLTEVKISFLEKQNS